MPDALAEFLSAPSGNSFLRLRAEVMAQPDFDIGADDLDELEALVAAGDYHAVPDKMASMMPSWLLSPRAHLLCAHAARHQDDSDRFERERALAQACLIGLTDSGDGSSGSPFRVTHVDDEYDLLEFLGRRLVSHRLQTRDDGVFDLIKCDDGSELWFDVTGVLP